MNPTEYRNLYESELSRALFCHFIRHQVVGRCWRREEGQWVIRDAPFIDDWTEQDYQTLLSGLRQTLQQGGLVCGAFRNGQLKGFAAVKSRPSGPRQEYLDLAELHVSEDVRGQGVGTALFHLAEAWARERGAEKLYISAHSAVESQAFYRRMGCVEAVWQDPVHVAQEPFDCQLERVL